MGAYSFEETSIGTTPVAAYNRAVEQALYEHGHDPYSGTIATTEGFIDFSQMLANFTPPRRAKIASASLGCAEYDPEWHDHYADVKWTKKVQVGGRTFLMDKAIRPAEYAAVVTMGERIDKWGPCGCYEVTGKAAADAKARAGLKGKRGLRVFVFFGWAAS